MLNLNAFHLDGVNRPKNETNILLANKTHNSTEITPSSLTKLEGKPLSGIKSNTTGKPSTNNDEMKVYGKPWRASKHTVPEKSSNLRKMPGHPKRESVNHPAWHKGFKDLHKLASVNSGKENGFNGFDIVVVDIPPTYSLRWDKPRINALASSPSYRYVPMSPSPSIFDLFLGLNSMAGLADSAEEMENEIYYQPSLENSLWNRRLSMDRLLSPPPIHQKAMNGHRVTKEVNANQLFGKLSEAMKNCSCTCGARN